MIRNTVRTGALLCLTLLSSCGFYNEKDPPNPSTAPATPNWATVSALVFQPRCSICHSLGGAGFNSSNYNDVVSMISQVQRRALVQQSMPADSPLTPFENKVLTNWIAQGTPQ